ncbi:PTB domain-containing engulfment adapter protein 1-like isoform X2 [Lingula anatina]|uniref:PTB domain-containing engulfment adapter protein 1-like isoform X2 n=1 Tax=Lingula anatina TaxID=7574 RepID=A0A1S3H464_LINAN|nr:PTB domain-containing engulfment adapter protein 1-like isoform X2 [Lingula anatina]|eukprot:XP_013379929.1 PTB domain-containing engulfment adapter protein 1-like isoform X2 [Lingula anatina]
MESLPKARSYMNSKENIVLVPNASFGKRKFIQFSVMNRQTSFARWVQGQKENQSHSRNMNKQWVHPPEALLRGHIVYNVKYLGGCGVETAKGSDVVKDAIRKMKFNKQLKKSEGIKPAKVELTISVDGVTIQDPKTKIIKHQYPLHRISYCADDKSDKRMFTFIAKEADSQDHTCHVFDSEKCSEEITLTVGQAFDLAYRKFLESSGRDMDLKKQFLLLQKKVQALSHENQELKTRIQELEGMKDRDEIQRYMEQNHSITPASPVSPADLIDYNFYFGHHSDLSTVATEATETNAENNHREVPTVGRRLEGLIFEDDFVPQTNGSATPNTSQSSPSQLPILSPPPSTGKRPHHGTPTSPASTSNNQDLLGSNPFTSPSNNVSGGEDPFGMGAFNPSAKDLDHAIMKVDKELLDLQRGKLQWPWSEITPGKFES